MPLMSVILDIDLDYFRFLDGPLERLNELLAWAGRPVDAIFKDHHEALRFWTDAVEEGVIDTPQFILHVDEHHDMLCDRLPINAGNFLYFAMRRWPDCRVHWLVDVKIDSPEQWLPEDQWKSLARRFTSGNRLRPGWRTPGMVTVCTSPGFLDGALCKRLLAACKRRAKTVPSTDRGATAKGAWRTGLRRQGDSQ
jgi:hypothetical protein